MALLLCPALQSSAIASSLVRDVRALPPQWGWEGALWELPWSYPGPFPSLGSLQCSNPFVSGGRG